MVVDPAAVAADDELIEHLRAGDTPAGPLARLLAAWRDWCRR